MTMRDLLEDELSFVYGAAGAGKRRKKRRKAKRRGSNSNSRSNNRSNSRSGASRS
jgi:hypothetical protein